MSFRSELRLAVFAESNSSGHLTAIDGPVELERNAAAIGRQRTQTLCHFGGEYDRGPNGITVKGDEKALAEALGRHDSGYQGYAGFELCHPLPIVNGQTVGIDFVDKNAQPAAEYMRGVVAEAGKLRG
jgi:hypothetical protein